MPQFQEETLKKMLIRTKDSTVTTLSSICKKYNIQLGTF